ncbi:histidine phosphatase [Thozetella sp. PMI_491]|nr:histidine phosphatase [Thozetella sp. PMI_491]
MRSLTIASLVAAAGLAQCQSLATDLSVISRYWGQISTYADNSEDYFGVNDVGLPAGCGIEQAHLLHRHAQRFPTSSYDDGINNEAFAAKVLNWTTTNPSKSFAGPLAFLNTYKYIMGESYLTGIGAVTEFASGVDFWNRYGRILFNATAGQVAYNASFTNGTARPKPVLRTTGQSRIENSQISWALGFFGPSFQLSPVPSLANWTAPFEVVVIPEGGTENNTLASYDSCINSDAEPFVELGDMDLEKYLPRYLGVATQRLQKYAPAGFNLTVNDTYAMQSICAYETGYIGQSQFCGLFTLDEWAGFENTLDTEYYYDYAYGNPTGRAQGIGYLQELTARLTNQLITVSNSSINVTIDNNTKDFPLGQKFYADFTHDDIIISLLTAMSLDYIRDPPTLTQWPPNPNRRFVLSHLTPFGARLVTEVIGCNSTSPTAETAASTIYHAGDNGYSVASASHKFVRMRLNHGILPLHTIRGGGCAGRTDGLCALEDFLASQSNATAMANYQFACFGNYTIANATSGQDFDGTVFA